MNPLSLRATNYRTFDELSLDLPEGCLAVVGENGAGKSSIVNVIDLALFGPESRSLGDYLAEDANGTELELELTFEHAGELYRVRRGFSAKGRGKTTLDFEQGDGGFSEYDGRLLPSSEWSPLTRGSQRETQEAIEETLGLQRETFRASAFLMQGDGAAFSEAQPRDRKRILAQVLGLTVWERLRDAAGADRAHTERLLAELGGRIASIEARTPMLAELEETVSRLRARCSEIESEHATRLRKLDEAAVAVRELERAEATYRERRAAYDAARARLDEHARIAEDALEATSLAAGIEDEIAKLGDPAATIAELERRQADYDAQRERRREAEAERDRLLADAEDLRRQAVAVHEEREQVRAELVRLRRSAADLNDPAKAQRCPTCEQELHGEAHATALARVREARDDAERRVAAYGERIGKLNASEQAKRSYAQTIEIPEAPEGPAYAALVDELREARANERTLAVLRSELAGHERTIARAQTPEYRLELDARKQAALDAAAALDEHSEPEPGALEALQGEVVRAKGTVTELERELRESREAAVRAESSLEQARDLAAELHTARAEQEELRGELDLLSLLERAYGRDGIPALIVETSAIPQIEAEANRILQELGTPYRVELRTQRELKSGDGLADTLDVVVIGEIGARPYETFSGGERTRINLALRIALARLLAHRRGAESRLLAIDEPEFLDEAGTSALAAVLRGLEPEFDRIVLVSHVPGLRDAFDRTLEVVKRDGRSEVIAA